MTRGVFGNAAPTVARSAAFIGGLSIGLLGAAAAAAASCVYVANSESDSVSVVDTASNAVVATIEEDCGSGRCDPAGLAVSPDGRFLYVANGGEDQSGNTVSVVATATNEVVATVTVGPAPGRPALTVDGHYAYVPNLGDLEGGTPGTTLSVIDTATALSDPGSAVVDTIELGATPIAVALAPDGRLAYVATFAGEVLVVDTATGAVRATVPRGGGFLAISPTGDRLYAANPFENTVAVVDTARALTNPMHAVTKTIAVGDQPWTPAIAPGGAFVYVPNCGPACIETGTTSSVSLVDTSRNAVSATVPLPPASGPSSVALTADGRFAYVTESGANSLAVIDTAKALATPAEAVIATIPVGPRPFDVAIASVPGGCAGTGLPCVGDCDGGGEVAVNELITMVNIALGNADVGTCAPGDANGDGTIAINELIAAVNKALDGC